MLHDAQFSCFFLAWMSVLLFLLSTVGYGVFWEASSVGIVAGGVFLLHLPSPVFVLSGDGCKRVASSGWNPGAYEA